MGVLGLQAERGCKPRPRDIFFDFGTVGIIFELVIANDAQIEIL